MTINWEAEDGAAPSLPSPGSGSDRARRAETALGSALAPCAVVPRLPSFITLTTLEQAVALLDEYIQANARQELTIAKLRFALEHAEAAHELTRFAHDIAERVTQA